MAPNDLKKNFDTFLNQKLVRLESKAKAAIVVAAVVLPLALFYFLLYSPKQEEIAALQANKASLELEIGHLEAKARKIDEHRAEMAEVDRKFLLASQLIPEQKEIPSLLTGISGLATTSGLHVLTFTPKPEQAREFYAEIPVDIKVKGSYHNFGDFLYQVSRMPRIAVISKINLSSPSMVAGQMQLGIDFDLTTYRSIDPKDLDGTRK
jgi:type IV pilus assembly protein PilO